MDKESQQILHVILQKEPAALTEGDIAFLRARADYLTKEQKREYKDALTVEEPKPTEPTNPNPQTTQPQN